MTERPGTLSLAAAVETRDQLLPRPESRDALFAVVRTAYKLSDDFQFSAAGTPEADESVAWALWDHLEDPSLPRPHLPGDPPLRPLAPELRTPEGRRMAKVLASQIRSWRDARRLTQHQLADMLDWDQSHVARLENGGIVPTLATLARLAARLGVRIVVTPGMNGAEIVLDAA